MTTLVGTLSTVVPKKEYGESATTQTQLENTHSQHFKLTYDNDIPYGTTADQSDSTLKCR